MHRKYQPDGMLRFSRKNMLLDFNVLSRFLHLPIAKQEAIAGKLGGSAKECVKLLEDIERQTIELF